MNMERKHSPELRSSHFSEVTCFPAVIGANQPTTLGHKPSASERSAEHQSEPNLHQRRGLPSPTRNSAPQKAKSSNNIIAVPPIGQRIGSQQSPPAEAAIATVSLSTQKSAAAEQQQREAKRHSLQSSRGEEGMLVALQQKLFEHYHTVAYTLVILTYFLALCEYFYLRLISLIFPQPIHYKRHCDKHQDEEILRNELHFASGMAIFLVMSFYQLVCFFLLTVSSKYLEVRRTFSHVLSIEQRLHHELVFAVKRTMFSTLYPTFAIYLLCSSVIFCSIFYMVGLRDPIVHVGARIIIHMFDLCVILYFLAFPVLCVLFHPDINCLVRIRCARKARSPRLQTSGGAAKCGDAFSSGGIGKEKTIAPIRRQPTGGGGGGAVHPVDAQAAEAANARQSPAATVEHGGGGTPTASGGTNYGSLERCRIAEETEEKEMATQTELVRQRMRQRRQSRYKRLRDGDESAECQDPDSLETRVRRNQAAGVAGRANEQRNDENEEEREGEGRSENSSSSSSHGTEEEEEENEDRESAFNKTVRATSTGLRLELRDPDGFGPVSC